MKNIVFVMALLCVLTSCGSKHNESSSISSARSSNSIQTQTNQPLDSEATETATLSASPSPEPNPSLNSIWEYAGTHEHPYEGKLISFEVQNNHLVSIVFQPEVALIEPTNPVDNPSTDDLGKPKAVWLRDDDEVSSVLSKEQLNHLKKNETYIVLIDPWMVNGNYTTGTMTSTIFYKKDNRYVSLKDDSSFNSCGTEGCKRVQKESSAH